MGMRKDSWDVDARTAMHFTLDLLNTRCNLLKLEGILPAGNQCTQVGNSPFRLTGYFSPP